ncbi:MAG: glycosyl hydrolase family 18 protein [Patescibacteria group bacterium]
MISTTSNALSSITKNIIISLIATSLVLGAMPAFAATSKSKAPSYEGEVSGWLPWWTDSAGIKSATKNIKKLDTIYPFSFEVLADGTIVDKAGMGDKEWRDFIKLAKKNRVEVIPTIAWFDGNQIGAIISDENRREDHIDDIVRIVKKGKYDGINIDYEGKNAANINHFSAFLKELKAELGRKLLTCAIEARTPAVDLYAVVPNPLTYANDYKAIGQYCDRIELMTYDQQRADLTLNNKRAGTGLPYAPLADKEWVEKVIKLALNDFPKEKVLVGVATYGRAWDITLTPTGIQDYTRVASLNHPRIQELSESIYKTPIGYSVGGEAVMSYFPEDSIYKVLNSLPVPAGTAKGYENIARAQLFATMAKTPVSVRFINYNDAVSAQDKLNLAKKYDVRGVTFFKIDGEEDPNIWKLF